MSADVFDGGKFTVPRRALHGTMNRFVPLAFQRTAIMPAFASIVLMLSGCATTHGVTVRAEPEKRARIQLSEEKGWTEAQICDALQYHIVQVDQSGRYRQIKTNLSCGGEDPYSQPDKFETHVSKIREQITEDYKGVVFIVHGGLNPWRKGLQEALVLNRAISADEELSPQEKRFPIFINWRSGLAHAYWEQLFNIRKGQVKKSWARTTAPIELASDVGRGISDMPSSGMLELWRMYDSYKPDFNACVEGDSTPPEVLCPDEKKANKGGIIASMKHLLGTPVYWALTPVRMVTAPFVNGPGRPAWENMIRRTQNAFWREPEPNNQAERGGVRELFEQLFVSKDSCGLGGPETEISLIGHSMGTMIVSDLLHAYPKCPYKDIVFMGAAVSIRAFQEKAAPALLRCTNPPTCTEPHFYNLCLLPTAEARETAFFAMVPSGSLLEWIDEMYTPPTTKFDRTLGKWGNVSEVLNTIPEKLREKMTFRVFGMAEGEPTVHGEFNDLEMCFWRESFWSSPWGEHQEGCRQFLREQFNLRIR